MKRIGLAWFFCVFFTSWAMAGIHIVEPRDKSLTFEQVVMLEGRGENLKDFRVNNQGLEFNEDGSFSCGLVLNPGKNLVEITALDKKGQRFNEKLRLLKAKSFPDMEILYAGQRHWARQQVVNLAALGIIEGYPDNNFYPANPITRGEFATWVARAQKLEIQKLSRDVFFDVPKEHWRAPYIKAVVDSGYMMGEDAATFGISRSLTRQEVATIALATAKFENPEIGRGGGSIDVVLKRGLMIGVSRKKAIFEADRALTRAEAATLLSRFIRVTEALKELFDYSRGYGADRYCSLNVPPTIVSVVLEPQTIQSQQAAVVSIEVQVAPREGLAPISGVTIDLSPLLGPPDAKMYDDGSHGDKSGNDLVYTLEMSLQPEKSSENLLTVTVLDRLGWENKKQVVFLVLE